jgi:hypothetical protein
MDSSAEVRSDNLWDRAVIGHILIWWHCPPGHIIAEPTLTVLFWQLLCVLQTDRLSATYERMAQDFEDRGLDLAFVQENRC